MKIRWNINEEQKLKNEETKSLPVNRFTTNIKNLIPQEGLNKLKETSTKQNPVYERSKRTYEKFQQNANYLGMKNPNITQNTSLHPIKLLNKEEVLNESKKMIMVEKDFEDFNKNNIKKIDWGQKHENINLNIPEDEITTQIENSDTSANIAIFHLESFFKIDENLVEFDKNISNNNIITNKILNQQYFIEKKMRFPEIIFELINANQEENINSFTGMYSALNLLYFVKNEIIYFWDYEQNRMYTFKEIPTNILYIHFATPKQGIFAHDINKIAIIATTEEIYIILIRRNEDFSYSFLKSDFVIEIGDYYITSICSSNEGRVFLGSQNYNLYELDYSNAYSFFGFFKKANKIVHSQPSIFNKLIPFFLKQSNHIAKLEIDNTRHILYCLIYYTNDQNVFKFESVTYSSLIVYDLGPDGTQFNKLGEINQESICERYNQLNMRQDKEKNFVIKEVFPLTRKDSKYYHLILITKNGLRVYISFDIEISNEPIENEDLKLELNPNVIYRCRPTMKYSIIIKPLPEPTNSKAFEFRPQDRAFRLLVSDTDRNEKNVFFADHKLILFYKDEFRKQSFLDIIEFDDTVNIKSDLNFVVNRNLGISGSGAFAPRLLANGESLNGNIANNSNNFAERSLFGYNNTGSSDQIIGGFKNVENILNIFNFDYSKEIHGFYRNQGNKGRSENFLDFSNLLKSIGNALNLLDSENFISVEFMNRFSKQIFDIPEQYILFTSSELIFINKKRPIDELFKIILDSEGMENSKNPLPNDFIIFLNKFGLSETSYMLLIIFVNYNMKFNYYEDEQSSGNPSIDGLGEAKEFSEKINKNYVDRMDIINRSVDNTSIIGPTIASGKTHTFMRQIKNNENFMKKAFDFYLRLIDFDTLVFNKNIQIGFENEVFSESDRILDMQQVRYNFSKEVDNIGRPIIDLPNLKFNHITYSIFMYIARISRIFWESSFYTRKGETKEDFLIESLRIYQLENLILIFSDFLQILSERKDIILQKISEFQIKKNNFSQSLQAQPQGLDSTNPLKIPINLASLDYTQISSDFSEIFLLCQKITETLKFVNFLYDFPTLKAHLYDIPKNIQKDLLNYRFKDLIKKSSSLTIQNWIEEFFELSLKEKDCSIVAEKLDEIFQACPKILGEAQKEIITANMLVKYSEDRQTNNIAKRNMIDKAVQLMLRNPYKIRLEYVIKVLGDNCKIQELIRICVLKSSYLKTLLDEDYTDVLSGLNVSGSGFGISGASNSFLRSTSEGILDKGINNKPKPTTRNINLARNLVSNNMSYNPELESNQKTMNYFNKDQITSNIHNYNQTGKLDKKFENLSNKSNFNLDRDKHQYSDNKIDDYSGRRFNYARSNNSSGVFGKFNSSFSGFENIYELNNLENNYNFCEFKKCIYTILKFLEEIHNSIKTHKKFPQKKKQQFLTINPNDSFSDFYYKNLKDINEKNLNQRNSIIKFSLFSLFKKLGFSSSFGNDIDKTEKNSLLNYEAQEKLIGNLIKEIIYNKFWDFSLEDKIELQNIIIEEILKHEKFKFLHILIFDHFKAKGMTEEILKYKSPYIEEYLRKNAMEKDDYSDLKTNNSLISFYINDKNYLKAFDILVKLAYQENKNLPTENFNKNAINISKRIEYLKKANFILEKLLREKGDDEKKNFYASFKDKISKKISTLEIQNEIIFNLNKVINHQQKINSGIDLTHYHELVNELNFSVYDIEELYFNYASKFKLHEIKIMILFENFKMKNSPFISFQDIRNIYLDAFTFYANKDENYPNSLISLLSTIFVLFIKNHTDFHNFYDAYRHSSPDHSIREIIPFEYIINIIENFNWQKIYNQNEIDFEKYSKERYDKPNNPFWFILFLKEKANIPIHLIYKYYTNLQNTDDFKNQKEMIINATLVFIINIWCDRIEEYIQKLNTTSVKISKDLFADYQEFNKNDRFINNFFINIYQKLENNAFKIRHDFIIDSNINYIKNVEKRYTVLIKRSLTTSMKFKTPSLYSDDSFTYSDRNFRIPEINSNRRDCDGEQKNFFGKSNSAQNFDYKNNLKNPNFNNLINENELASSKNFNTFQNRFNFGVQENKSEKNNLLNNNDI